MKSKIKIDTDIEPKPPFDGWTLKEHIKAGKINLEDIELFKVPLKNLEDYVEGTVLKERINNEPVLNQGVADYLFKNRELIPSEWKEHWGVYFFGTVWEDSPGHLRVPFLRWLGEEWDLDWGWLEDDCSSGARLVRLCKKLPVGNSELEVLESRILDLEEFQRKVSKFIILD